MGGGEGGGMELDGKSPMIHVLRVVITNLAYQW